MHTFSTIFLSVIFNIKTKFGIACGPFDLLYDTDVRLEFL